MKYPAICKFTTLLCCLLGLTQSTTAQLCAGSWALQRPLTSQCVVGQWVGWENTSEPSGCPTNPNYIGTQSNTFTFNNPVNTFTLDFRGTDGLSGCARVELKVNGIFYPLSVTNLFEIPVDAGCTSGLLSNIFLTPEGYITISGTGGPGRVGLGRIVINHTNVMSFTVSTNDFNGTIFSNPFNCSGVVPIKIESFSGAVSQTCKKVNLTWRTGMELNVNRIEVERKEPDFSFQKIATVVPRGSGSQYFIEVDHSNDAFYRLRTIDLDGTYQYSKTIFVKARCNEDLYQIYPNPSSGIISIAALRQKDLVRILDLQGRVLNDFKNFQEYNSLDVSWLAPSMYLLQIIQEGKVVSNLKFMKK